MTRFKKILVTGASGVAGSGLKAIAKEYEENEFTFLASRDCDLTDPQAVDTLFARLRPDAVLHMAAISGGIGLSTKHPATLLRDNVLMNVNVVEAARKYEIEKTVMSLSTGMYSPNAPLPIKEDYIHDGPPHSSNYSYAFAKRLVDPMIRAWRSEFGMNLIGVVPNGIFGEHDNFNYDDATLTPTLIRRFYENRGGDKAIVMWGDGSPLREVTYGKDIARAYMWCLEHYDEPQILHIGTTEEHSVREIAEMLADMYGISRERLEFDTSKPAGVSRKSTDNSRFVRLSDFKYTAYRTALENTVRWYVETSERNPANIRKGSKLFVRPEVATGRLR
ncbi:MAG: NAD-dependent epimerase/dehydratase family protein [Euryarchaeota archaeon]|nr:NAD-dependent epimerase/dehydratase family protein [Euryarchaeota archaeon]